MKWLVRKGKSPGNSKEAFMFEEIDLNYKDGDPKLKKEFEGLGYEEWAAYPESQGSDPLPEIGTNTKRKYEIFCGGYLYYHDIQFKKYPEGRGITIENGDLKWKDYTPGFEHKIYFEWFREKLDKKEMERVRIYINSTPPDYNTNPPPPPKPPPPES